MDRSTQSSAWMTMATSIIAKGMSVVRVTILSYAATMCMGRVHPFTGSLSQLKVCGIDSILLIKGAVAWK